MPHKPSRRKPLITVDRKGNTVINSRTGRYVFEDAFGSSAMEIKTKPNDAAIAVPKANSTIRLTDEADTELLAVAGTGGSTGDSNVTSSLTVSRPILEVTANTTLYAADTGALVYLNTGAGSTVTVTLPDAGEAAVIGTTFTFFSFDANTNTKKIAFADTTNTKFVGKITLVRSDLENDTLVGGQVLTFAGTETSKHTITWNGTTSGSQGSFITLVAAATDRWLILDGTIYCTGGVATPFGT